MDTAISKRSTVCVRYIRSATTVTLLGVLTAAAVFRYFTSGSKLIDGPSGSDAYSLMTCYFLPALYCSLFVIIYLHDSWNVTECSSYLFLAPEEKAEAVVFAMCSTASLSVVSSVVFKFWADVWMQIDKLGSSLLHDAAMSHKFLAVFWLTTCYFLRFFPLFAAWVVTIWDWTLLWDMFLEIDWDETGPMEEMEGGRVEQTVMKEPESYDKVKNTHNMDVKDTWTKRDGLIQMDAV